MDDPIVLVVILALIGEMLYSLRCAWWMRHRYGRRLMKSDVWDRLVEGQVRTVMASLIMLALVIYGFAVYLFMIPMIPRPFGTILLAIALALLLYGPIADKRLLERIERREGGE